MHTDTNNYNCIAIRITSFLAQDYQAVTLPRLCIYINNYEHKYVYITTSEFPGLQVAA